MDYALAKELKDAGFPQEETLFFFNEDKERIMRLFPNVEYEDPVLACPSLSQLIEACGVSENTGLYLSGHSKTHWVAARGSGQGVGSTPEEAVARLWLSLHKK